MQFAILTFPGTNCEKDLHHCLTTILGQQAHYIPHHIADDTALDHVDGIFLPGGASYGDREAPGRIASQDPIIKALHRANSQGKTIVGICNGFQILTQAGLLPGQLLPNPIKKFICKTVPIQVATTDSRFTNQYKKGQIVHYPIAHLSGNYQCTPAQLNEAQVLFTYQSDINGSVDQIAGITNQAGNVLGLMPHPERAVEMLFGNTDGLGLFRSMFQSIFQSILSSAK